MNSKDDPLFLAWVPFKTAQYAVEHWHYSGTFPKHGRHPSVGVWEHGSYRGAVVFGDGTSSRIGEKYGATKSECTELLRVALRSHEAKVSRIVAIAIRILTEKNPGLRLLISFADPRQGHIGSIYQAGGWRYLGTTESADILVVNGVEMQSRGLVDTRRTSKTPMRDRTMLEWVRATKDPNAYVIRSLPKHRYAFPLDERMSEALEKFRLPYPKKPCAVSSGEAVTTSDGTAFEPTTAL